MLAGISLSIAIAMIYGFLSRSIFGAIVVAIIGAWFTYVAMPVFSFDHMGWSAYLLIPFFMGLAQSMLNSDETKIATALPYLLIFVIAWTVATVNTWSFFHADEYRSLLTDINDGNFSDDVPKIDLDQIRVVDQGMASVLGDKVIGSVVGLGSQVSVGTFNIQSIKGKLYWVAPLLHSGVFKWFDNQQGTPGYIMVSATDTSDVKMVKELNGKPLNIKYQPNAYFSSNIERHLYTNGYSTDGLTDYTFEIDDSGTPYYVVSKYTKEVGIAGAVINGVVTVNVQTGEIIEYGIDKAPAWIDRIQPWENTIARLNDWGEYVHGWFNPSNKDKLKTTPGTSLVYASGKSYWYTGLTSVGGDDSTVGYVLVDTRTMETFLYNQSGATESSVKAAVERLYPEKRYIATYPILYNIEGFPTYVMRMKDSSGRPKPLYAMVSVKNYEVIGVGDTLQNALRRYIASMNSKGASLDADSVVRAVTTNGTIGRIDSDVSEGNETYYFTLHSEKGKGKVFVMTSRVSEEIVLTLPNDPVEVTFSQGSRNIASVSAFDNQRLHME